MTKITEETLEDIERDYAKWAEFLNGVVGLFAFALAISCLGTARPDITGFSSLAFLLLIMYRGRKTFPKKYLS